MAPERDPVVVACIGVDSASYQDPSRRPHQEIDWQMRVKIDGLESFGHLPPDEFKTLIQTRVEEAARQGLGFLQHNKNTPPQPHLVETANLDFGMTTERLSMWEIEANPFIGIFELKGRIEMDASLPVSPDEVFSTIKARLAKDIADRVASLADGSDGAMA